MASISSILSPNLLQQHLTKPFAIPQQPNSKLSLHSLKSPNPTPISLRFSISHLGSNSKQPKWVSAVAEDTSVSTQDPSSEVARRVYIGNIPRTVNNDELRQIVEEHGAVEKAEQIGGREIKANITEKPLQTMDLPFFQSEESEFIDSPHKVYVGNLAKTVTTEMLKNFFAEKGKVLSAKVSRVPGTSKSSGFGFVTFSSEEDVEAVISSVNNALLEGQKIRVNKA
ncbi:30S ribosomal protein 2, chloroplastic-like isoform X2 [Camellia sinensis]|uniref:30S ribosomal protein 2, chloroplastic-like isoform X2 n=1 Tax=Camellia sinensis TaxID=4442 RepID=UPI00103647EB|nr:30S ribosomal protein 2, chloroplastic-like isoform X2 [Camellia sinensis]